MPPIFKALATVTVWILFVFGCLLLLMPSVMGTIGGIFFRPGVPPPLLLYIAYGLGVASLILSVCAMKLRKMLE